ncbi:MAG: VCBS repeat-containing protein [Planctomycetes bacterium]|nr:VCBS repeat-containing protein [Planctomycetota bacterium]
MNVRRSWCRDLVPVVAATLFAAGGLAAQARFGWRWDAHVDALQYESPIHLNDFAVGDVDGDGDPDVLAGGNAGTWLWRNDGHAAFGREDLPGAGSVRCVALVDVDGDADLDALLGGGRTTYEGPASCALAINDGLGRFTAVATIPPTPVGQYFTTHALGTGDLDGDGDADAVFFPGDSRLRIWRNDGGGTFTDVSGSSVPAGAGYRAGRVFDHDGDGDLDILHLDGALLHNDGHGVFTPVAGVTLPCVEVGDLDGDGDIDLIQAQGVRRNDGGGVFTAVGSLPPVYGLSLRVVDFDGDGRRDLLGVDPQARAVALRSTAAFVWADVTTTWFAPGSLIDRTAGYGFGTCIAADLDGDGDADFVTGGSEGRSGSSTTVGIPPKVFVNVAQQRFHEVGQPAFPWVQQQASALAAGDIDGDSDIDLAFGYLGYGNQPTGVAIWRQDDAGTFAPTALLPVEVSGLTLVDVDGDGDLDLFGATGGGPTGFSLARRPLLAQNDGHGVFTDVSATALPPLWVHGASCAAGDVDGDGDQDLVLGEFDITLNGNAPLHLLTNRGNGVFDDASAQLPAQPLDADQLALRDFDGDGDLDLAIAVGFLQTVGLGTRLYQNDGTGRFRDVTATAVPAGNLGSGVNAIDLDRDGDLDLAQRDGTLQNDGRGVFTAMPGPSSRLLAADLDGVGLPDDVLSGSFGLVLGGQSVVFGWNPWDHRVLPVDLDGDQDLDVVAACLIGFQGPQWATAQIGVLWNLRSDLRSMTWPRLGHPWRLRVQATTSAAGTLAIVVVAPGRLAVPLRIPGLGTLVIDPAALGVAGVHVLQDGAVTAAVTVAIPNSPVLQGMDATSQAVFVPVDNLAGARLSAGLTLPIVP